MIEDYILMGLALCPIPAGKKGPTTTGWNLPENAITTIEDAHRIKGNVGILHAYCTPTPTCAIDIDCFDLATDWLEGHGISLSELLNAADAVQIISGKAGRAKLLYRLPAGIKPLTTVQIQDQPSKQMILELRCAAGTGRSMQDVLPPSIHPDTNAPYTWGGGGDWRKLPVLSPELLNIWQSEMKVKKATRPKCNKTGAHATAPLRESGLFLSKAIDDSPRQRAIITSILYHISSDCTYDVYRDIVWAILSLGWVDAEELARQWCMTVPLRYDAYSFDLIVANYDERRTPTYGTLMHHAKQGGRHE